MMMDRRMVAMGGLNRYVMGTAVLLAVLIGGLSYVKWTPYYHNAFVVASRHTVGVSIVSGQSATAPTPSIGAALSYAWAYG
ncbi:MAG TPA: hypothetical protein VKG64_05380, partial [Methylomirabilota bacterium]|nr:hypothetical protein [Methylomirabilota bacterium]